MPALREPDASAADDRGPRIVEQIFTHVGLRSAPVRLVPAHSPPDFVADLVADRIV